MVQGALRLVDLSLPMGCQYPDLRIGTLAIRATRVTSFDLNNHSKALSSNTVTFSKPLGAKTSMYELREHSSVRNSHSLHLHPSALLCAFV